LKPNASACFFIASAPTSMASCAKVVLHDQAIASSKLIRLGLHCDRPSLSTRPVSPRVSGSW
jgi:hypothetical protein